MPVLILAGAGTGKTRVIAHRIAYLLERHPHWTPANLLALTFSRKAAQELCERVEGLLGTHADSLEISTFHGFCHRFLTHHAVELGLPVRFQLLDQTESWIFFRTLLDELKLSIHWSLSDPTGCIDGFLKFISRAKDELVTPRAYAAYAAGLSDPQERRGAQEIARVYRVYQNRMRENGFIDFGDLIVETLQALEGRPKLLQALRQQYHSILVDEFQDTNVAQIALLEKLAGDAGNLCVVGDDDQAIYRFRGASFASFLLMKEAFPNVKTLRLSQNYRSSQRILSVSERLIRHNEPDRYDPEKRLWTENPEGGPVEVCQVRDEEEEAQVVVRKIQERYEAQPAGSRCWDRIAVLYRAHAHRERLVEVLRANDVPFVVRGGSVLFKEPAIKDLVALLRVLQDPGQSSDLFRLLAHPVWGIPAEDLLTISRLAREHRTPLWETVRGFRALKVPETTKKTVAEFIQEITRLRKEVPRIAIGSLIERITEDSFLRTVFRMTSQAGGSAQEWSDPLIGLGRFLRFVRRYSQTHPQKQDLESFLWTLESVLLARAREPVEEDEQELGDRVRLMTVHQAKGLEFDWVILLGMTQGRFPSRARPEPIPFPVELMKESLPKGDWHLQEERRLCYVACTRARQGLILLTQERAYHRSSLFVREMIEGASASEVRKVEVSQAGVLPAKRNPEGKGSLATEREVLELLQKIRALDLADEAGFTSAVRRVSQLAGSCRGSQHRAVPTATPFPVQEKFSYTQLETYRTCPLKYLYAYIYRIPFKTTPAMAFGLDLHEVLEEFFAQVMKGSVPSLKELVDSFGRLQVTGRYGEPFQEREYQKLGKELLSAFYRKQGRRFPVPVFVEKSFSLKLGQIWMTGVMDRVDELPEGGVEIIDYKSGRPKERASAEDQLQIRLYALACREVFELEPKRVSFYYLRNNRKLSFEQEPAALEETRQRILELTTQIRSGNYEPSPSVMKCRRCDFRNLCPASKA